MIVPMLAKWVDADLWYVQVSFLLHVTRKINHYSYQGV